MYKSERHVIPLSEDDEVIVDLGFSAPGVLSEVSVNYRARIRGEWMEVLRYDNAHGLPHRHRFWMTPPESALPAAISATRLVQVAKTDLYQNWLHYRRSMEASR